MLKFRSAWFMTCVCLTAVLSVVGCSVESRDPKSDDENPVVGWMHRQTQEMEALSQAFREIQSPADAKRLTPTIREGYQKLAALKREAPALFKKHRDDKVDKDTIKRARSEVARADRDLAAATRAIQSRIDLPESFHTMVRLDAMKFALATVELEQELKSGDSNGLGDPGTYKRLIAFYEKHGPSRVVEIIIRGELPESEAPFMKPLGEAAEGLTGNDRRFVAMAPVDDFHAYCQSLSEVGEVTERDAARRSLVFKLHDPDAPTQSAATPPTPEQWARSRVDDAPPVARDDYARLAERLGSEFFHEKQEAAAALLGGDLRHVGDKQVLRQIAKGFRDLTKDSHYMAFESDTAVLGLMLYGGKYSIPILIEMAREEDVGRDDMLLKALATFSSPEVVEVFAAKLDDFGDRRDAIEALRQIGSLAEDAALADAQRAVREDEYFHIRETLQLLADIGTSKSEPFLQEVLQGDRNRHPGEAAEALRRVRLREQDDP